MVWMQLFERLSLRKEVKRYKDWIWCILLGRVDERLSYFVLEDSFSVRSDTMDMGGG
jgi:hypothetical protein